MIKKLSIFIFGCLFSFMCGLGIRHGYAKYVNSEMYMGSKVESVQSLSTRVSYDVIYVRGNYYVVFSNATGSDIEVQKLSK